MLPVRPLACTLLLALALLPLGLAQRALQAAPQASFTVNSFADVPDAQVGDGKCETAPGNETCTLRAAIQEANADPGRDTIILPAGLYLLSRPGNDDNSVNGDLDVMGDLSLLGAGAADTIIDGSAMSNRVLDIISGDVTLAGVTFAEKAGTFTNTERRIQLARQALRPQAGAHPDWEIIGELARRIPRNGQNGEFGGWDYDSTAQIMAEAAALTPIYAGVSHERLERINNLQWPVMNLSHPGTPILAPEQFREGRGRFLPVDFGAAEQTQSTAEPA